MLIVGIYSNPLGLFPQCSILVSSFIYCACFGICMLAFVSEDILRLVGKC